MSNVENFTKERIEKVEKALGNNLKLANLLIHNDVAELDSVRRIDIPSIEDDVLKAINENETEVLDLYDLALRYPPIDEEDVYPKENPEKNLLITVLDVVSIQNRYLGMTELLKDDLDGLPEDLKVF
jgi:hypothetical protein